VPSKHKNISKYLRSGFFDGIKTFRDFEARTDELCANSTEVGDTLEILVEAYLYLNPVLKAKNVWLVGDIPLKIRKELNLPADATGIDGVYEDASGKLIPYQVKYRTNMDTLPFGEVGTFLGITEESLNDRVIFTNARNLADKIIQRKGIRSVRAAQFHDLTEQDFKDIYAWLTDKKPAPKLWSPLPHQKEAIEKITAELKQANRTTAVMACGTGKTLVALWAAEAQEPKTVLVLVPSLALLSQTLPDWCKQTKWGDRFRYLCVCSDASVDQSAKNDDYALKQSDLEFSVTTNPNQVKSFLSENTSGVNVIFSTYQSAEVVAEGLKGKSVDFAIFDEAHKTTGPKEGLFAFGLSDKNISIKKRLFLTATPRHYDLRKRDKDGDFRTISMDDEKVYGKISYRLSFSAAVTAGIIVPYKVIISLSLNKDVDDELLRQGSTLVRRNQIQAKWVANQIALKRAIKKTSASKIITFHSRVSLAKEFAGDDSRGFSEHVKGFDVFHVNGEQNAADRKALLDGFKTAPKSLITNARCLTEGVDVPAVDMVAFVDPRKSKIDIAQAAGRAMRQSKATNKKLGYIVVPLFIEQKKGETEEAALSRSGFDEVAEVLRAMLETDDDLLDNIREMQEARGRGDKFNPKILREKIKVIGPLIDLERLEQSIDIKICDYLGSDWDMNYGLLQKFHVSEGHCRVPKGYTADGFSQLPTWVRTQRRFKKNNQLDVDRIKRLDALGFTWDVLMDWWEEGYDALQKYHSREGHCVVPVEYSFDKFKLGHWVRTQRRFKKNNQLDVDRIKRLDALGFSWDPHVSQWEEGYAALQKYHAREGHCRVPQGHREDGFKLGTWVFTQRARKHTPHKDRIKKLDALGFTWDVLTDQWEEGFAALKKYHAREGNCLVPRGYIKDGFKIGLWVFTQRRGKKNNQLDVDRIKRLDALGFSWDPHVSQWEEGYAALQKYHAREGHCRVPQGHREDGFKLGTWVSVQRRLSTDRETNIGRIKRLNSLSFTWDILTDQWEEGFAALKKYHAREGHCSAPFLYKQNGFKLGSWICTQRQFRIKNKLSESQIKRLDSLGFIWDPRSSQWEEGYVALQKYHAREGHCRVPTLYCSKDGFKLGKWVSLQRFKGNKKQLIIERLNRLNALGFLWKV
jgi:superfamily II DNA or RNA helicase